MPYICDSEDAQRFCFFIALFVYVVVNSVFLDSELTRDFDHFPVAEVAFIKKLYGRN